MAPATTTVAVQSGLDEIDARRHITTALVDVLDDIDASDGYERYDGDESRCADPANETAARDLASQVARALETIAPVANRVGVINDPTVGRLHGSCGRVTRPLVHRAHG
jgi:hypothetical protein